MTLPLIPLVRQPDDFQSNIRPAEGSGTYVWPLSDGKRQTFNLTASRTVVLPSTNVKAGDRYEIGNTGAFDLTVQSSNGLALTVANGSSIEATIQLGYVLLEALQDAPTQPSHWRVVDLFETAVLPSITSLIVGSGTGSLSAITVTAQFIRNNRIVTNNIRWQFTVTGTVNQVGITSGIPTRFVLGSSLSFLASSFFSIGTSCFQNVTNQSNGQIFAGNATNTLGNLNPYATGSNLFSTEVTYFKS